MFTAGHSFKNCFRTDGGPIICVHGSVNRSETVVACGAKDNSPCSTGHQILQHELSSTQVLPENSTKSASEIQVHLEIVYAAISHVLPTIIF